MALKVVFKEKSKHVFMETSFSAFCREDYFEAQYSFGNVILGFFWGEGEEIFSITAIILFFLLISTSCFLPERI